MIPTLDFPHFYNILGGNLGSLLHWDVSVMSVFEKEGDNQLLGFPEQKYTIELLDVEITEEKVDKLISKLKPSKSQDPDNFHPKLIKETANELKKPLTIICKKICRNMEKSQSDCNFQKGR